MTQFKLPSTSRRNFLKTTGFVGLSIGVCLPRSALLAQGVAAGPSLAPNAFVRVGVDNTVTVVIKHLEMGQGVYTGLSAIVAEELDASWVQMRAETAPADASRYNNLAFGPMQGTGGSTAVANSYEQLRKAGAQARAMLVEAAAKRWGVSPSAVIVADGVASSGSQRASFGDLAEAASKLPVPLEVKLKDPSQFKLIGKPGLKRLDSEGKTTGEAKFASDIKRPGQLTALVLRPPRYGGKVKSIDASGLQGLAGVRSVVEIPQGVAVVGTNFWSTKVARDKLKVEWDDSAASRVSSKAQLADYRALLDKPGLPARSEGDVAKALGTATKKFEAVYEFPYLAHAPMEPLSCVVELTEGGVDVWAGAQFHTIDQGNVAGVLGLKPEQVRIHTTFAGGSFGRRANLASDFLVEACEVVKALKKNNLNAPVRLLWTREDDIKGGRYRPSYVHKITATLGTDGRPEAWSHRIVGQSILTGTPFEAFYVKNGVDGTSVEGASNLPYAIPNLAIDLHTTTSGVPVLWWRSVGSTHTAFSTEVHLDELALATGKDPVAYRLDLLAKHPRHSAVLKLAADKAQWSAPLTPRAGVKRARGVAVHESFGTVVAQVVEVSVKPDNSFSVDRVVCAVDCGVAVTPDVVVAQMEGSVGFALSAALFGKVTLNDGLVEQSNFHDYRQLRINEMPKVEVHIVPSANAPTGVGEPGVPPLAPALANALAAATGKRLRALPLSLA